MRWHAGIAVAGLIAISLCLTVTILELMKLKREALAEAAQKEEAGKALNRPALPALPPQPGARQLPAQGHLQVILWMSSGTQTGT